MSAQIDVLIWDSSGHAPLFRDGEFVAIPPEACRAAIEIKGNLGRSDLHEALGNLERVTSLARFAADYGQATPPFRAVFAFETQANSPTEPADDQDSEPADDQDSEPADDQDASSDDARDKKKSAKGNAITWPTTIFNCLWTHYTKGGDPEYPWALADRVQHSRQVSTSAALPWIDMVCLLGVGFVQQEEWSFNDLDPTPTYSAFVCDETNDGTYSALDRGLRMRLLAPNGYLHSRPGMASMLFADERRAQPAYMPMEMPPQQVVTIGRLSPSDVAELAANFHRPRGAKGWPKAK